MGDIGRPIRITQRPPPEPVAAGSRAGAGADADAGADAAQASPGPAMSVESVDEPLVGFRRWGARRGGLYSGIFVAGRFVPTPARTIVAPRVMPMPWPPGEPHVAKCWALRGHHAPFGECHCGLSAYYELPEEPDLPAPGAVWGAIVAWGRVVECETGFRARFARPVGLLDAYNPLDFARPLKRTRDAAAAYGVPLLPRDELAAYARWHGELGSAA